MGILWEQSNQIVRDDSDERASGALIYFFVGNTTTPLTTYSDALEATPRTHPVVASATGRVPAIFIPYCASYDVKVTTAGGTQLFYTTGIPNDDPVEASEDSVDAEELIATGHVHWEPINTTKAGFVRLNARTIGSAASGATERANADAEPLFTYLWTNLADSIAAVSTGRGASAAADFAANKTITLLDGRSGVLRGLDSMGNSAASRLDATINAFTTGGINEPGSKHGSATHTLTTAQIPQLSVSVGGTPTGSIVSTVTDDRTWNTKTSNTGAGSDTVNAAAAASGTTNNQPFTSVNGSITCASTFTGDSLTSTGNTTNAAGGSHNNVSYGLLGTFFQKL